MNDNEMLFWLRDFFDGHVMSADDVVYYTGLPVAGAQKVYEAIQRLRSMEIKPIQPK